MVLCEWNFINTLWTHSIDDCSPIIACCVYSSSSTWWQILQIHTLCYKLCGPLNWFDFVLRVVSHIASIRIINMDSFEQWVIGTYTIRAPVVWAYQRNNTFEICFIKIIYNCIRSEIFSPLDLWWRYLWITIHVQCDSKHEISRKLSVSNSYDFMGLQGQ